ncbi:MAG: phosphonate C-P lyase system protein PhnH [Deltaproteobacteria bacterium]|nr:phosphonate C-P lyase system protein PhnH [Deltaproteobacteria bacterium]
MTKVMMTRQKLAGDSISGGFTDYCLSSQIVFRWALQALSSPTSEISADSRAFFQDSPPLPPLMAALALTLTDHHTPVWISDNYHDAKSWLSFHQGVVVTETPSEALFFIISSCSEIPPLEYLKIGTERYPDHSATFILEKSASNKGPSLTATGAGIKEKTIFSNHDFSYEFVSLWAKNTASYPTGIDILLAGESTLIGLPRTVKLILN